MEASWTDSNGEVQRQIFASCVQCSEYFKVYPSLILKIHRHTPLFEWQYFKFKLPLDLKVEDHPEPPRSKMWDCQECHKTVKCLSKKVHLASQSHLQCQRNNRGDPLPNTPKPQTWECVDCHKTIKCLSKNAHLASQSHQRNIPRGETPLTPLEGKPL